MRLGTLVLAALGVLFFGTLPAGAADVVPEGVIIQSGVGPAGVIEVLDEAQPPEPEAPPRVARQHPYDVPTEVFNEIKRRQIAPGDNGAQVVRAGSLLGRTQAPTVAPPLEVSFTGLFASNLAPPDPCMAVGPNHIVLAVNTRFNVYNKNGATQAANSYATFFSNVNTLSVFDPKIVYDHFARRWITVILGVGASASSYLIAVSDDDDPRGTWYKYSSPANIDGSTVTTHGADYPGIGFDQEAVYITSNQFANFLTGGFMYSKIRIFKKSELYNNAAPPLSYTDITRMQDPSDGGFTFTIKPMIPWDDTIPGIFLVNTQGSVGSNIELWRLTNPLTAPTLAHRASIPIGGYSAPPDAVQPFGVALVNTNSSTGQSEVHYRNGKLYFAFPQAHNFGGGTVSAIRYLELDTAGTVNQNIIYGADGEEHYFPAPMPLKSGNVAMVFSHSSASSYPSARYVGNFPNDLSAGILKAGDTTYLCNFCGARNRWGDYAGIWNDPVVPRRVWLFHEYARKPQPNTWGTWCGAITLENHSPVLSDPGPQSLNEGDSLAVNVSADEPDGEPLSYQLLSPSPPYVSFTDLGGGQGQLTLAPGCFDAGVDTVYLVASDNAAPALADTTVVEITVLEKNCAPQAVVTAPDTILINQCQTLSFAISAADPDSSGSVSLSAAPAPAFATVTDLGGGSGSLNLSPAVTDLGAYTVQVLASDGQDTGIVSLPVQVFQKGDLNRDGTLAPADVVLLLNCIFLGLTPPAGAGACDMDGGGLTISDVVVHLNAIYLMEPLPPC